MNIQGNLYIVAAPSGGGKTSLVRTVLANLDNIVVSISHTTRPKRPGENEGVDYFFINEPQFLDMVNNNEFVEHAVVFSHYYGTSVAQIQQRLQQGIDIVLDIDWQGAQQIRHLFPTAISIFVIPPSLQVLKERLRNRRQDSEEVITDRMHRAQEEMSHYPEFDYLIVNDNFDHAALELQAIVLTQRLQMSQQSHRQRKLLSFLLSSK